MVFNNPFDNPLFIPSLKIVGLLFVFGFGLVLFFARKDLKAGLGRAGQAFHRLDDHRPVVPRRHLRRRGRRRPHPALLFLPRDRRVRARRRRGAALCGLSLHPHSHYLRHRRRSFPICISPCRPDSILLLTLGPDSQPPRREPVPPALIRRARLSVSGVVHGAFDSAQQQAGIGLVMLVGVGVALSDVMQYTVGKLIGRHIISPEVNPRKAWEGLIGRLPGRRRGGGSVRLCPAAASSRSCRRSRWPSSSASARPGAT